MKTTEYKDFQNTCFYCEFSSGGWDNVDPVYKVEEDDEVILVYGGCMTPGNDCYTYYKDTLLFWKISDITET